MIKHICDCCGKEVSSTAVIRIREIAPTAKELEDFAFSNKDLCPECAENYRESAGAALVKVWDDMRRDKYLTMGGFSSMGGHEI